VLAGGFGSAVWETLNDAGATPRILRVGLPDRYVTHGKPALLHDEVGFTGERIAERVAAALFDRGDRRTIRRPRPRGAGSAIIGA
jgi:1-deoxy-D-xylulose-5-phosphate synthase